MNDAMRDEILSLTGAKLTWSRRDFVVSGLATGFTLSVQHADYRPSYRKTQAEDGWKRLQEWFKKHL